MSIVTLLGLMENVLFFRRREALFDLSLKFGKVGHQWFSYPLCPARRLIYWMRKR